VYPLPNINFLQIGSYVCFHTSVKRNQSSCAHSERRQKVSGLRFLSAFRRCMPGAHTQRSGVLMIGTAIFSYRDSRADLKIRHIFLCRAVVELPVSTSPIRFSCFMVPSEAPCPAHPTQACGALQCIFIGTQSVHSESSSLPKAYHFQGVDRACLWTAMVQLRHKCS
jgi:hypothetical protein